MSNLAELKKEVVNSLHPKWKEKKKGKVSSGRLSEACCEETANDPQSSELVTSF